MLRASIIRPTVVAVCLAMTVWSASAATNHQDMKLSTDFDRKEALAISQGAIGNQVSDARLQRADGSYVKLADYRGKPLVMSFIYTSCFHICPTTTSHLDQVVQKARAALGEDSFNVITIGFDTLRDTPPMMKQFAGAQRVKDEHWQFLSADSQTIDTLTEETGFIFFPSPNGFDHLVQTTIIDEQGKVFRQIYGMNFKVPSLIEPLKNLVFETTSEDDFLESVGNQVRLFCTVYDPSRDVYRFDYSIFIGTFIGILCVGFVGYNLVKEWRYTLRHKS